MLSVHSPIVSDGKTALFYYDCHDLLPPLEFLVKTPLRATNLLNKYVLSFLQLLFIYAGRCSEFLNICSSDVLAGDRVLVRGLKHSSSYIVYLPRIYVHCFGVPRKFHPFKIFPFSYHKIYLACKKIGIVLPRSEEGNDIVTHIARYDVAQQVENFSDDFTAGQVLRHRSADSIKYYLNLKEG